MKKEVVFAIFAGIIIGLMFAFGSWKVVKQIKKPTNLPRPTQVPVTNNKHYLTVNKITNNYVVGDDFILSGEANPNSLIVVITPETDYLVKTNENGTFEIKITLQTLLNEVSILSISEDNKIINQKYTLIYDEVLGGSQENINSFIGTITDIATDTVQIKDLQGLIKQINVYEETSYINNLKKNSAIKYTDLAIGDYIVSIGTLDDRKVLLAKKFITTSPIVENKNKLVKMKIEKIDKKTLTVINEQNQKEEILLPKKWNGPELKELEIGQEIFVVGSYDDKGVFSLRSLYSNVQ